MSGVHAAYCKQDSWQLCLWCGARVCGCRGTARGQCPECYGGLLTNYYRLGHEACGYKHCKNHAVVAVPRVKFACAEHAVKYRKRPDALRLPARAPVRPTTHTVRVCEALGIDLGDEQ